MIRKVLCLLTWLAVSFAFANLGGCAASTEPPERTGQASEAVYEYSRETRFDVGNGTTRILNEICAAGCVQWQAEYNPKVGPFRRCVKWETSCDHGSIDKRLYADDAAFAAGTVFPAENDPTWVYMGCGPQAAQNILNYYGVPLPIATVASAIGVLRFDSKNIATPPQWLANGLQSLLNQYGDGIFSVQRLSDQGDVEGLILQEVMNGRPPIVLTKGGNHFQVVTGAEAVDVAGWNYHLIDYSGNDKWVQGKDLGTSLNLAPELLTFAACNGEYGWCDDTVITISRTPTPPCGKVDFNTDPNNCGGCWTQCVSDQYCSGGSCVWPPSANPQTCGGILTDVNVDPVNCGVCGSSCDPATQACSGGSCVSACGGVPVDFTSDPNNCGGCGFLCGSSESCTGAVCTAPASGG